MYYFAYGSNMDQNQMESRCPGAKCLGAAVLSEYRLGFTIYSPDRWKGGCADIIATPGQAVWGVLYKVTVLHQRRLDYFEGHPSAYHRCNVSVLFEGELIKALAYEVTRKSSGDLEPSPVYLSKLIRAANEFDFPLDYHRYLESFIK